MTPTKRTTGTSIFASKTRLALSGLRDGVWDNRIRAAQTGCPHRYHRYLYAPGVDALLADEYFGGREDEGFDDGQLRWAATDHQGSVRQLVDLFVDGMEEVERVLEHREYDAFGNITDVRDDGGNPENFDAIDSVFGFAGREWDVDTELSYNRARWFDPRVGRFLSEDPLGLAAGDANFYRCAGNDPVNFRDPTGLTQAGNPVDGLSRRLSAIIDFGDAGFDPAQIASLSGSVTDELQRYVEQFDSLQRQANRLRSQGAPSEALNDVLVQLNHARDNARFTLNSALRGTPREQIDYGAEYLPTSVVGAFTDVVQVAGIAAFNATSDTAFNFATVGGLIPPFSWESAIHASARRTTLIMARSVWLRRADSACSPAD
jgi:RHS repeat-associated protein